MLAVGPVAILPSPVWAALPTSSSFSLQNGSATVSSVGSNGAGVATISTSDRAILQWVGGNFTIANGETYNFQMPAGGAVLNRVGTTASADTAAISGQIDSNGRVFILAPGGTINITQGASVTATGGLVLSTLAEDNGSFLTSGNLVMLAGASNGAITIGGANGNPLITTAPQFSSTLTVVGGTVSIASLSAAGDAVVRSVNAATPLSLGANGNVTVVGNLSVTATNSDITQASGAGAGTITVGDTYYMTKLATFTTTGSNSITLDNVNNDFSNISLNTAVGSAVAGNVTVKDKSDVYLSNSTIGGNLAVTAAGSSTYNAIATVGTVAVSGNADFSTTGAITRTGVSITQNSTVGGVLSGTVSNNSSFSFTGVGNVSVGNITTANLTTAATSGGVTVNVTGNVTMLAGTSIVTAGNNATNGGAISLTGAAVNTSAGTLTTGNGTQSGTVTLNATAGNLTVGNATANRTFTLRAGAGNITQATGTTIGTTATNVTNVVAALGDVKLDGLNSLAVSGTGATQISGANATLTNTNGLTIGTSTLTGDLALNAVGAATNVQLGQGAGTAAQKISVGGNLSINVVNGTALAPTANSGNITDNDYSALSVFGAVNLVTSGGNITLDAATANGALAPSVLLGAINISVPTATPALTAPTVSIAESTTVNLGNVTAAALRVASAQGGIIDSGNVSVTGASTFVLSANNSLTLDSANNKFGTVNVAGNGQASITANQAITLGTGTVLTGNLAVTTSAGNGISVDAIAVTGGLNLNSGGTVDFINSPVAPAVTAPTSVSGNLSVVAAGGAINQTGTGGLIVGGTATVAAGNATTAAAVTLDKTNNDFNTLALGGSTGAVTVNDANNLTLSGSAAGTVTVKAGAGTALANTWNLTLGNLTVGSLVAEASNGGAGNSGTITQASGTSVSSNGLSKFNTTNNNIVLGNTGNNFGRVEVTVGSTDGSRTVTVVEEGTMRVGNVSSRGTTTLTSRSGSIIEDPDANVNVTNNGTLVLSAVNGSVLLGNLSTRTGAFTTTGSVVSANISAPNGAAAVFSTANLTLGTTNVNSLTVTSGNNIAQSAALNVFGSASFKATNNITLSNTANNFGRVSLETTTASRNITITEGGTLNLGTVAMQGGATGSFTATSVNGDIIDTGLAKVVIGGTTAAAGTGVITLNATAGNIVLDDPTTEFASTGGVVFNSNNVTLAPLGAVGLVLGSAAAPAVATGNLTVTTALATGNITSAGSVQVGGDASFQAASANIQLVGAANKFGSLRFIAKEVSIIESDDMAIATGSTALSSASLSSGGNVSILNRGGIVSFNAQGGATTISASGNITLPKLVQVLGTLTVNASGTKDLSALSKSADLGGKEPNNSGTGAYLPPGQ